MESVSTRLDDETVRLIRETADERGESMAEVLRELIEKGMEYDDLKQERDRLQRQLAATNQRVDQHQELVEYVQSERTVAERKARAGALTRLRWWLGGMPDDDEGEA